MKFHKFGVLAVAAMSVVVSVRSQTTLGTTTTTTVLSPAPTAGPQPGGTAPSLLAIPAPISATALGQDSSDGHSIFSLGLNWNEAVRHFAVAVPNNTSNPVTVLGVQASGELFLTKMPGTIAGNATGDFHCLLVSSAGSGITSSYLRVLTSTGMIVTEVRHDRAAVAQFSASRLVWPVGGGTAPQSVTLTMVADTAVPVGVTALGKNNTATIQATGSQQYTITVTPGSAAKAESFPVVVTFNPGLPGVSSVIGCEVK